MISEARKENEDINEKIKIGNNKEHPKSLKEGRRKDSRNNSNNNSLIHVPIDPKVFKLPQGSNKSSISQFEQYTKTNRNVIEISPRGLEKRQ